jgi:hypothetical protein
MPMEKVCICSGEKVYYIYGRGAGWYTLRERRFVYVKVEKVVIYIC